MMLRRFRRCVSGATAAEFALVLPLLLMFMLGLIDVGRVMWTMNRAEKATQMGARYAVATAVLPQGLNCPLLVRERGRQGSKQVFPVHDRSAKPQPVVSCMTRHRCSLLTVMRRMCSVAKGWTGNPRPAGLPAS